MSNENRVGARSLADIVADPQASAEDILSIRRTNPIAALNHPNCPPEVWWDLAADHPLAAPSSVLYELLTLEEPGRWEKEERGYAEQYAIQWAFDIPVELRRLFAADCAEHVLPLFLRRYPKDKTMQHAIVVARRRAHGLATEKEITVADVRAATALRIARQNNEQRFKTSPHVAAQNETCAAWIAACAIHSALTTEEPLGENSNVPRYGQNAAYFSVYPKNPPPQDYKEAKTTEAVWQWHRLVEYINGNVT